MNNNQYSHKISVFHGRTAPEAGSLAGYAALIAAHELRVPPADYASGKFADVVNQSYLGI